MSCRPVAVLATSIVAALAAVPSAVAAETDHLPTSAPSQITFSYDARNTGPVSARFNWVTTQDVKASVIRYDRKDFYERTGTLRFTESGRHLDVATPDHRAQPITGHKVEIDNLKQDEEYVYTVGDGLRMSAIESFRTRSAADHDFTFHWFTDAQRSDYDGYVGYLADAVKHANLDAPNPDFAIFTGDQVNDTYKSEQWAGFFASIQPYLASTPTFAMIGNHEYEGNPRDGYPNWESPDPWFQEFDARFNIPQNGPAVTGAADGGPTATGDAAKVLDGTSYSFSYGDAEFFVLNHFDQLIADAYDPQLEWLKREAAASKARWKIVLYHHGLYLGRRANPHRYQEIAAAFDEAKIDLALSGHDHMYVRTHPLKGNQPVAAGEGTTYITGASAGQGAGYDYNPSRNGWSTAFVLDNKEASYQTVRVTKKGVTVNARHRDPLTKQYEETEVFTLTKPLSKAGTNAAK